MGQRVFVKVVGFTDVERHALNTVFRLSEQRETIYSLWMADAPEPPRLGLIDGQSQEARLEFESGDSPEFRLIWVGAVAPANAWRTFQRPIVWPDVVRAMDQLFAPSDLLDFDLDFDDDVPDTRPSDEPPPKRALIIGADRDERLYLRAKLALAQLTQADEAESGAQALELARANRYSVALVDFALPDVDGWAFLKELAEAKSAIPHVIVLKEKPSPTERLRGRLAGVEAFFEKPVTPGKLHSLLKKI